MTSILLALNKAQVSQTAERVARENAAPAPAPQSAPTPSICFRCKAAPLLDSRGRRIVQRLRDLPYKKLREAQEPGYLQKRFAHELDEARAVFDSTDLSLDDVLANPLHSSLVRNLDHVLKGLVRGSILVCPNKPELNLLSIELVQLMPRGYTKNPMATAFFGLTREEMHLLHENQVLMVKAEWKSKPVDLELEILLAFEEYRDRCMELFVAYMEPQALETEQTLREAMERDGHTCTRHTES